MHRTEGPDYVTESGKRRHKETPLPATVVNKFVMNALQEEICLAIENAGITLAASGAADRAAGWAQLDAAIIARGAVALAHVTANGNSHSSVVLNNTHRTLMEEYDAGKTIATTPTSDGSIANNNSFLRYRLLGNRLEVYVAFSADLSGSPTYIEMPLDPIPGISSSTTSFAPQRGVAISYQTASASTVIFWKSYSNATIRFYVDTGNLPLGTPVFCDVKAILVASSL